MPEDDAPKKRDPEGRRDAMATVGEWLRSSELFNWVILVGFVLIGGVLLSPFPLVLLIVSLGLLAASAWRFRMDDRKWGVALLIACVFLFPFGVLTDPGLLTRNG